MGTCTETRMKTGIEINRANETDTEEWKKLKPLYAPHGKN